MSESEVGKMETVTVNIVSRWDSTNILFSVEVDAKISARLRIRAAVEIGVNAGAYLDGANLVGANLDGASLAGAYLAGANLVGANLVGANLDGANLDGANLAGANLVGANLDGANLARANLARANFARANLDGAYLDGKSTLIGERPIFMIGPIGSESRTFMAYITSQGPRIRAGCFFGTREEFLARLKNKHGGNAHAQEYMAALALIDAHFKLWAPDAVEGAVA